MSGQPTTAWPTKDLSGGEAIRRRLLEALSAPLAPSTTTCLTYEEFLDWTDEDTLAEWVDGEVLMTSPASDRHQDLVRFLTSVVSIYVETHKLGIVRPAPFQMKLKHSGREPDLLFVATEHLDRLKETYLDGPADLVVEIVSPESAGRDRGEKFYEYAQGGVPEYWLLDPQMEWAEFYQLTGERYRLALEGNEGEYRAPAVPGFWLRIEWLWREPLPEALRVLGEIAGVEAETVEPFLQALRAAG
jgi:Uma2 family endonuclease